MKTKLLRKVRKEYSIVDYPTQNKIAWYCKRKWHKREYIWDKDYSDHITRKMCINQAYESIIKDIRNRYKKLGAINRGKKIRY